MLDIKPKIETTPSSEVEPDNQPPFYADDESNLVIGRPALVELVTVGHKTRDIQARVNRVRLGRVLSRSSPAAPDVRLGQIEEAGELLHHNFETLSVAHAETNPDLANRFAVYGSQVLDMLYFGEHKR